MISPSAAALGRSGPEVESIARRGYAAISELPGRLAELGEGRIDAGRTAEEPLAPSGVGKDRAVVRALEVQHRCDVRPIRVGRTTTAAARGGPFGEHAGKH
jgi:hypothetical protein